MFAGTARRRSSLAPAGSLCLHHHHHHTLLLAGDAAAGDGSNGAAAKAGLLLGGSGSGSITLARAPADASIQVFSLAFTGRTSAPQQQHQYRCHCCHGGDSAAASPAGGSGSGGSGVGGGGAKGCSIAWLDLVEDADGDSLRCAAAQIRRLCSSTPNPHPTTTQLTPLAPPNTRAQALL